MLGKVHAVFGPHSPRKNGPWAWKCSLSNDKGSHSLCQLITTCRNTFPCFRLKECSLSFFEACASHGICPTPLLYLSFEGRGCCLSMTALEGRARANCSVSSVLGTCWPWEITVGGHQAVSLLRVSKAQLHAMLLRCVLFGDSSSTSSGQRGWRLSLGAGTVMVFTMLHGVGVLSWD